MTHSKRFLNTYKKMRALWERLIEKQKQGYLIFDGDNNLVGPLEIGDEHMLTEEWPDAGSTVYYGDNWTDEDMEKWTFMKKECFSKWKIINPKYMEKVI